MLRAILRVVLALGMVVIGVLHFVRPDGFVDIVPGFLPAHLAMVLVSGGFEVLGGVFIVWALWVGNDGRRSV